MELCRSDPSASDNPKDSLKYTMNGFSVVDEPRLAKFDDAEAGKLLRRGFMGWIYAHLLSMELDPQLKERKTA